MSNPQLHRVSEAEFLALPESTERLELLGGEVILSPSPSVRHQWILRQVVRQLEDWSSNAAEEVTVLMAPLDVRFSPGRILQPDAFVVLGAVPLDQAGPITQLPALCVEVLSSNRSHDRMTKRLVYAEAGVAQLWTISLDGTAERWFGEHLSERQESADVLTSPILPGFRLSLAELRRQ